MQMFSHKALTALMNLEMILSCYSLDQNPIEHLLCGRYWRDMLYIIKTLNEGICFRRVLLIPPVQLQTYLENFCSEDV